MGQTQTLWKCDEIRAGQLYERMFFDTKEQAEHFAERLKEIQPDFFFEITPVDAQQVWN
jgi:hypothetical protein